MNTQQLESFVRVAESLNFTRAAEALNSTTATISRQIRSLEDELDTKLLHRSTKSVSLTPAGISFFNDAREILAKCELASEKIRNHDEANIQILSIGYVNEAELPLMVNLLKRCKEKSPEIHPFLRIIPSRLVLNLFLHNEIDIIFNFKDNIPMRDDFLYHELAQIPVCCALPANHPLARNDEIAFTDLNSESIVICNSHEIPPLIASIQNLLGHQFAPHATYYSDNLQAMLTLIKAGYGIGILPEMSPNDTSIVFVPLNEDYSLSYGFFYKDAVQNPTLKKFLSLLNVK